MELKADRDIVEDIAMFLQTSHDQLSNLIVDTRDKTNEAFKYMVQKVTDLEK